MKSAQCFNRKSQGKRPRRGWYGNISIEFRGLQCELTDCTGLVQNRVQGKTDCTLY